MKKQLKEARKEFREKVFKRDDNSCVMCDCHESDDIAAHHIINRNHIPYGGYVPNNGITLCSDCHLRAEDTYFGRSQYYDQDYTPDKLFMAIGSNWLDVLKECMENQKELDIELGK